MTQKTKLLGLVAGITFAGAMASSAAIIDFTAPIVTDPIPGPTINGTVSGIGYTVTAKKA